MKFFLNVLHEQGWFLVFFAMVALIPLVPMASNLYIPNEKDFYNHVATIIQAKMALAEGQFPLRVAPLEQSGWRYPWFQFYSPTSYTFAALIYKWFTPNNPFIAYKFTLWCALVAGGFYMKRLAFWFTKSKAAALLAGVVYLTAPYCFIVINRVGGFNEGIALGIIPVVIYYTLQRFFYPTKNITLVQAALAWYVLVTVHMVTFVYTTLLTVCLLFFLAMQKPSIGRRLLHVGIAYSLACLMAMWFLAPLAILQKYLVITATFEDAISFYNDFSPNILSLISPMANFIIKLDNVVGTVRPSIGLPIIFGIGIAIYAFFNRSSLQKEHSNELLMPFLGVFLVAFLLAWSPVNFWLWLPDQLRLGQYSWRILSQVMWVGALLFAWAICWLFKYELDGRHVVVGMLLIIIASSSWLTMIDRPLFPVANILKSPTLVFAESSYLINVQRNTQFINVVDNLLLDTLMPHHILKFDYSYYISAKLLTYATHPFLLIQGNAPSLIDQGNNKIMAVINNKVIDEWHLKPGSFIWKISLKNLKSLKPNDLLAIQFKKSGPFFSKQASNIAIEKVVLTGFLNPTETLNVKQVESHCHQYKIDTVCKIDVPLNVKLLELPVLYYPNLLTVTLNGHIVAQQSILYRYLGLVGIKPEAGKTNIIKIRFTGLAWANWISILAWCLWGAVVVSIGLSKLWLDSRWKSR